MTQLETREVIQPGKHPPESNTLANQCRRIRCFGRLERLLVADVSFCRVRIILLTPPCVLQPDVLFQAKDKSGLSVLGAAVRSKDTGMLTAVMNELEKHYPVMYDEVRRR